MNATADQLLKAAAARVSIIDLSAIGVLGSSEDWFFTVLLSISKDLDMASRFRDWWREQGSATVADRFVRFFSEVVLDRTPGRVVVFIDEIDSTLSLGFTDDFFGALRALFDRRSRQPNLDRLSFVLIGVATPDQLIKDPARTPFNVGHRIDVRDFERNELNPLAADLPCSDSDAGAVLDRVMYWTHGHPYLTLRVMRSLLEQKSDSWSSDEVDSRVRDLFLSGTDSQDINLQTVQRALTQPSADVASRNQLLREYRRILRRGSVRSDERSVIHARLKLSGIVRQDHGALVVRNRLYESVFTDRWACTHETGGIKRWLFDKWPWIVLGLFCVTAIWAVLAQISAILQAQNRLELEAALRLTQAAENSARSDRDKAKWAEAEAKTERSRAEHFRNLALARGALSRAAWLETRAPGSDEAAALAALALSIDPVAADLGLVYRILSNRPRQVALYQGRDQAIRAEFSATARKVFVATEQGFVLGWDLAARQKILDVRFEDRIIALALSPDEALLALGDDRGSVLVLDMRKNRIDVVARHSNAVISLAFSPDGRKLASGAHDGLARLRDLTTNADIASVQHKGAVGALTFVDQGRLLVTGANGDNAVRVINAHNGSIEKTLDGEPGTSSFAVSARGDLLAIGGARGIIIRRTRDWTEVVKTATSGEAVAMSWSPDSKNLVAGFNNAKASLWEVDRNLKVDLPHSGRVSSTAYSRDGAFFATAGGERNGATIRVWSASGQIYKLARVDGDLPIGALRFAMDSDRVIAVVGNDAHVWSTRQSGTLVGFTPAASPDGSLIAVITGDSIEVRRIRPDRIEAKLPMKGKPWRVALSNNADVVVAADEAGMLHVWDHSKYLGIRGSAVPERTTELVLSRDGAHLGMLTLYGVAHLRDLATGMSRRVRCPPPRGVPAQFEHINGVAFSGRDKIFAVVSNFGGVCLWDSVTAQKIGTIPEPNTSAGKTREETFWKGQGHDFAFAANTGLVALSSGRAASLWSLKPSRLVGKVPDSFGARELTFSTDGKLLAGESLAGSDIRVWELPEPQSARLSITIPGKIESDPPGEALPGF